MSSVLLTATASTAGQCVPQEGRCRCSPRTFAHSTRITYSIRKTSHVPVSIVEALTRHSNFAGLVLATDEGKEIAECLGAKKAALLGNHGLLTAGATIEATIAWFVLLEKCCQVQLAADASSAGTGKPLVEIGEAECRSTSQALGTPDGGYFMGLPLFQVAEREFGEKTYLGRGLRPI